MLLGLIWVRAEMVNARVADYIGCDGCFRAAVWGEDLVLLTAVAALLLLAGWIRFRPLALPLQLLAGLIVLAMLADIIVFHLYNYRLYFADAAHWATEWRAMWDQLSGAFGVLPTIALIGTTLAAIVVFCLLPPTFRRWSRVGVAAVLATASVGAAVLDRPPYVARWAIANVVSLNVVRPERVRYGPETQQRLLAAPAEATPVEAGPGNDRNVVLIILESWSSWHSRAFGGALNWTPSLDAAAEQGLKLDNFHSIGFTTADGLAGILAGERLWIPFHSLLRMPAVWHGQWGLAESVPSTFRDS
ncbi:MAG: sulfatase-like hydrolase/transferase, partial [Xanthomonadales bacterium]|nr:sulfatase-like hydrolase/transferase [Xanthomonadales bacterium]